MIFHGFRVCDVCLKPVPVVKLKEHNRQEMCQECIDFDVSLQEEAAIFEDLLWNTRERLDARTITKKRIEDWLRLGPDRSPVVTDAKSMLSGGHFRWWIENERVHCFGSGPGWTDQTSVISDGGDIKKYIDELYGRRKEIARNLEYMYTNYGSYI